MNLQRLLFVIVVVFSIHIPSQAVDTLRHALISPTPKMEAPQLPSLKSSAMGATRYKRTTQEPAAEIAEPSQDENLMNWTPMSIEALGYDIREVWRGSDEVLTFTLPFSR